MVARKQNKSACPVFRPSHEQVSGSWEAFVESIERKIAGPGICKIVPPKGWTPRKKGYSAKLDFEIPQPIRQIATGSRGLYRLLLVQGKSQSLARDFRPMATAKDNEPPRVDSVGELERHYWRNVMLRPPQYGADVEGSLFDRGLKVGPVLREWRSCRHVIKHPAGVLGLSGVGDKEAIWLYATPLHLIACSGCFLGRPEHKRWFSGTLFLDLSDRLC